MGKFSGYSHLKVSWTRHQINQKDEFLPSSPSPYNESGAKISPAVVLIIVILAVLFFICGLLHLLIRFLTKSTSPSESNRSAEDYSSSDALQRQLQQLFDLHDSGLDQAFIDALPVFSYKEISGPKELFDCAVCLCEFSEADELRLLPICSHAFHINCIDTWLLSNSTCPLCREAPLIPGFSFVNPAFDYDDIREEGGPGHGKNGYPDDQKRVEIEENATEKGVFPVRLGKFQRLNDARLAGESSSSALDARRCYSMGSYQYVVGNAELRVALSQDQTRRGSNRVQGDNQAFSTLDARRCYSMDSHRYVDGNSKLRMALSQDQTGRGSNRVKGTDQASKTLDARRCYSMGSHQYVVGNGKLGDASSQDQTGHGLNLVEGVGQASNLSEGRKICIGSKSDSYSVSKIWLWSKKGKYATSSQVELENGRYCDMNNMIDL